jgi:hypothetical protein
VGEGDEDAPFTPPQPIVKARNKEPNKNKNARLKGAAPLMSLSLISSLQLASTFTVS